MEYQVCQQRISKRRPILIVLLAGAFFLGQTELALADETPAVTTNCDRLAADPYDPGRVGPGIPTKSLRMNLHAAEEACQAAVSDQPLTSRFHAYLARTLRLAKKYEAALGEAHIAAGSGSISAMATLGLMAGSGYGMVEDGPEAVKWLLNAAEANHGAAENNLGLMYYLGRAGLKRNFEEAVKWFQRGADHGSPNAQISMSSVYSVGWLRVKDPAQVFLWAMAAAKQGDMVGQTIVGDAYQQGIGVPSDGEKAVFWLRQAAEQGEAHAQTELALNYINGVGITKDYGQAMRWYKAAADQGVGLGAYNVGIMYVEAEAVQRDEIEGLRWFLKAIAGHYLKALDAVASVVASKPESLTWLRNEAHQGNVGAQLTLATMNKEGVGVPKNQNEATKWYLLAAQQGDSLAQQTVSVRYRLGIGVEKDPTMAAKWAEKSARQENILAQVMLAMQYEVGVGVPRNDMQAYKWYLSAAERGSLNAKFHLALLYHAGIGVSRDDIQSCMWASLAASLGHTDAQKLMNTLRRSMSTADFQKAEHLTADWIANYPALLGNEITVMVEE